MELVKYILAKQNIHLLILTKPKCQFIVMVNEANVHYQYVTFENNATMLSFSKFLYTKEIALRNDLRTLARYIRMLFLCSIFFIP